MLRLFLIDLKWHFCYVIFILGKVKYLISRSETVEGNGYLFIRIPFSSKSERRDTFSKRPEQMVDGVQPFQNQKQKVINIPTKVINIKY